MVKSETALSNALKTSAVVVPAGRTDSGVHSEFTVCHIEIEFKFNISKIKQSLNKSLIKTGIQVLDINIVDSDFHALSSATMRTYQYFFSFDVLPNYLAHSVAFIDRPPMFLPTNKALKKLFLGNKNYYSLCNHSAETKSYIREISNIHLSHKVHHSI